jgi:hypothetical protein
MNPPGGAATQIGSPQFDRRFFSLPPGHNPKFAVWQLDYCSSLRG